MNIIIATLVIIVILAALTGFQYLIFCALRSGRDQDDKLGHLYDDRQHPPVINGHLAPQSPASPTSHAESRARKQSTYFSARPGTAQDIRFVRQLRALLQQLKQPAAPEPTASPPLADSAEPSDSPRAVHTTRQRLAQELHSAGYQAEASHNPTPPSAS